MGSEMNRTNARRFTSFNTAVALAAAQCFATQETAGVGAAASTDAEDLDPNRAVGTVANPTPTKKISGKTLTGGNVKKAIKQAGGKPDQTDDEGNITEPANFVELYRVVGQVSGVKTGNSAYGEWRAYAGDILAITAGGTAKDKDGKDVAVPSEVFKGRELYLPAEADIVLWDPISAAVKEGTIVELAVAIEAKLAKTNVGYMYRVKPLMALEQPKSRAAELLAQFGGKNAPKLAAPTPATKLEAPAPAAAEESAAPKQEPEKVPAKGKK